LLPFGFGHQWKRMHLKERGVTEVIIEGTMEGDDLREDKSSLKMG
jgi:hypothetical protein